MNYMNKIIFTKICFFKYVEILTFFAPKRQGNFYVIPLVQIFRTIMIINTTDPPMAE